MAQGKATIDHDTIKNWVEERGGCPAHVKGSGSGNDPGILRIDYTGFSGTHSLEKISWDDFFAAFEDNKLAFLYQEDDDSRFSKLVSRDNAKLDGRGDGRSAKSGSKKSGGKKSGSAASGVDALSLLEQQHREVEELFDKLEAAKSPSQKERVFTKLADALAAHAKIEETIFYPTVFGEETESELRESVEEHLVAKRIIADMLAMDPSDAQFMSKALVLKEVIQHHVEEEEQELFPWVREQDTEDLQFLGKKLKQRYSQLMKAEPRSEVPKETQGAALPF